LGDLTTAAKSRKETEDLENERAGSVDRRTKFAALASKRVNRATHAIRTIGNLSNRSNYDWTEQDVKKIVRELRKAVKEVEDRFLGDKGPGSGDFFIKP
jgi:hypothetical protein